MGFDQREIRNGQHATKRPHRSISTMLVEV